MLDDARALCESHGFRVVGEHVDDGLSGAIRNRPGFVAWLADARELRAANLVAFHVDRMTREGVNVAALILDTIEGKDPETGRLVRAPARLLDCKGLDSAGDETAFRLTFVLKAEVAREERKAMARRSADARARLKLADRWGGGPLAFGFRAVANPAGEGQVLVPDPDEAAFVREMAERLLAESPLPAVLRWANGPFGRPPRRVPSWSRTTVCQMLTTTPQGTAEDILTPDERAALRQVLAQSPRTKPTGRAPARLLSGLLRCSGCDRRMFVANKGNGIRAYRSPPTPARVRGRCLFVPTCWTFTPRNDSSASTAPSLNTSVAPSCRARRR